VRSNPCEWYGAGAKDERRTYYEKTHDIVQDDGCKCRKLEGGDQYWQTELRATVADQSAERSNRGTAAER